MSVAEAQRCEHCGAELSERQRWCLACGVAALARVATTRRWAPAGAAAALITALALAGIGYAIATLASS